ncbi:hypothetical protein ACJIZ3_014833 [Penstemon smallii]|uniref:Uncharacterized protein n=1 Tax=Penstemon smallii TaxID=265156 RepID=A0ABD3RKZ2_9LAMI
MSANYDNWERLVAATLRREQLWHLFHSQSRSPSISSLDSDSTFPSPLPDLPFDFSTSVDENLKQDEIFVNDQLLDDKELIILQSCKNPPRKLKPGGNYWYDKSTGFWGKQGRKPSQIISANLNVGGRLDRYASNGNTLVYINAREISKVELLMLKYAGVKCYPHTNFLMYEDGSYRVEGELMKRGTIWGKSGMKLICSVLSLPFPPKSSYASGLISGPVYFKQEDIIPKFLLIGCTGSGATTICKQAKFLYKDIPFLDDELNNIKFLIQSNVYRYICMALESRKQFEEEISNQNQLSDERGLKVGDENIYHFGPKSKTFSEWLLHIKASGSLELLSHSLIQEYAQLVRKLCRQPAFQETLKRARELERLPNVANYFLERAVDIFKPNYIPSRNDIIYTEGFPKSLLYMDFSFPHDDIDDPDSENQQDSMQRYQLIRSPTKAFEDNYEWLEMSEDVRIVIFSVSLCDYDELVADAENGSLVNKMMLNKKLFENIVTHPCFHGTCFLLLLTKYDLFEEKLRESPLNQCDWFNEFHPIGPYHPYRPYPIDATMAFFHELTI